MAHRRRPQSTHALLASDIDHHQRHVRVELSSRLVKAPLRHLELEVPAIVGAIHSVELRGEFVVVFTEGGKVSYHVDEPRVGTHPNAPLRVSDIVHYQRDPRVGTIHWQSLRKILRDRCFVPKLASRVAVHITYFRGTNGGRSTRGASGWIAIDQRRVLQLPSDGIYPRHLGTAVANLVFDDPEESLDSENLLIASLATLHCGLSHEQVRATYADSFDHPIWHTLRDLRLAS